MTKENVRPYRYPHPALLLLAACLLCGSAYYAGYAKGDDKRELLYALNRSSIENMPAENTIRVIGHMSPDSDTVCSAAAYARLLNMLDYDAEAVITQPVNRETAFIFAQAGADIPRELPDASGETIFLVDHSEYAQSAEGMRDAHIVGILDHHGIGSVTTGHQVVYEARPIGAAATIVWLDYLNYGLEIDRQTACLLTGAVLSDTDGLTGSTTTEADREAVKQLSAIAGIADVQAFYRQMHIEKLSYEGMDDMEILYSDYKEYEASGTSFGIALTNAVDEETAAAIAERMKKALPDAHRERNVDLMYAAVSIRENGEKIDYVTAADEYSEAVLKDAFPDYEYDGTSYIYRKGLGRKTVFVPGLTEYLGAYPHE